MSLIEEDEKQAVFTRAKKRAMYLLGSKDYSPKAMYDKLLKNYPPEICRKTVDYLTEYGYLDEERYARKLAEYLIRTKKHGLYRARQEMAQKGVSRAAADLALEDYSKEDLRQELAELVQKKYSGKLDDPDDLRRTMAALARRGYGYEDIKAAIRQVRADALDEMEWE